MFSSPNLVLVSAVSLVGIALAMVVTALVGQRLGKVSVVDTTWGLAFVVVALVGAVLGQGPGWRRVLLLVLVAVWGGRLAWHITGKNRGKGEDPRYEKMKQGKSQARVMANVYGLQGVLVWFISLPLQVSAAAGDGVAVVAVLGVLVWLVGVVFEATGDAQLKAFKADPSNKGKIMDRGLWAWTRHPNYFGDFCVWVGLWLVAGSAWPGVLTVLSPVVMGYFLAIGSGGRLLEKEMSKRPGYREYMDRTSFFFPTPPKRA